MVSWCGAWPTNMLACGINWTERHWAARQYALWVNWGWQAVGRVGAPSILNSRKNKPPKGLRCVPLVRNGTPALSDTLYYFYRDRRRRLSQRLKWIKRVNTRSYCLGKRFSYFLFTPASNNFKGLWEILYFCVPTLGFLCIDYLMTLSAHQVYSLNCKSSHAF